jgi:DNA-directed RNA polymerase subunit F
MTPPRAGEPPAPARAAAATPADDALALARRLVALEEGPIRVRAAARALAALPPAAAAPAIAAFLRAPGPPLRAAAAAVAGALGDPREDLPYPWLAELYAEAAARGLTEVGALLVAPPPQRAYREPRDKADARLAHLTLGHKKALARARRDPDLLARLAAEGDPVVVRELLRNPQLTEEFVLRIASRRPCRPGTLRCVFESRRWRTRAPVALALARNPYCEPAIALELLSGVGASDLREISHDATLHPLVRAVAARLAAQRRP